MPIMLTTAQGIDERFTAVNFIKQYLISLYVVSVRERAWFYCNIIL